MGIRWRSLTAGMNSLYDSNGVVDKAASTQFLFLYDVAGAHKSRPVLEQVIQRLNAHVGLVWAPNSQTLYASGGCDDAVYAYSNNGTSFVLSAKISLATPQMAVSPTLPIGPASVSASSPTWRGLPFQPMAKRSSPPTTITIRLA